MRSQYIKAPYVKLYSILKSSSASGDQYLDPEVWLKKKTLKTAKKKIMINSKYLNKNKIAIISMSLFLKNKSANNNYKKKITLIHLSSWLISQHGPLGCPILFPIIRKWCMSSLVIELYKNEYFFFFFVKISISLTYYSMYRFRDCTAVHYKKLICCFAN